MPSPQQPSIFLSPGPKGEVRDLTGASQRAKQTETLTRQGIPYTVAHDGWPRVARAWVDAALATPKPTRSADEPDFSSLTRRHEGATDR